MKAECIRWGALWRQRSKLDGRTEHLLYKNGLPVLFTSRRKAREWITAWYGYIARRPDLWNEPHGWKMPVPVNVIILQMKGKRK